MRCFTLNATLGFCVCLFARVRVFGVVVFLVRAFACVCVRACVYMYVCVCACVDGYL